MRQFDARGEPPKVLARASNVATSSLCAKAVAKKKLTFASSIYAHKIVRNRLDQLQNGVCAYCEVCVRPVSPGDIEHFRPKGGYVDEDSGKYITPGYYWLAYSWTNLLVACPRCNQIWKRGRFPLSNEALRSTSPVDPSDFHLGVLIDPYAENPRDHIRFHREVPYAVKASVRGAGTITVLGLDAEDLNAARSKVLRTIRALRHVVIMLPGTQEAIEAEALLNEYQAPDGEFSSCVADYMAAGYP